jgi:hypothetical protein
LSFSHSSTVVQKRRRRLSDELITQSITAAISRKAHKVVAHAAEACERTVHEWKLGRRLPSAGALIRLMAADDEVYQAVIDLAGRSPVKSLSVRQKGELISVLKAAEVL